MSESYLHQVLILSSMNIYKRIPHIEILCCQNFYLYTISSLHLTRLEEFNTCEVNSRHQNSEHDESTKLSVRRKFWLLPTNLSGQIVTFGKNVFNCTYLVVKGVGHSAVTRLHFIAGTTNPDWWFVTILVLTSWDGRPLCLDRLYVRGIIGGQVPTSNTHQQIDFLRGCRREEGGGRRAVTDCDGYTVQLDSPPDFSTAGQIWLRRQERCGAARECKSSMRLPGLAVEGGGEGRVTWWPGCDKCVRW